MKVAAEVFRPAVSSVYEVAGRFLLVEASDPGSLQSIQRFLERWDLKLLRDPVREPDAMVSVFVGDALTIPSGFERFPLMDGAVGFASDTEYRIDFGGAILAADESNAVRVSLDQPLLDNSPILPQLVSHALSAALRRCDVFELHSGAVVDEVTGNSILICGPSGSGKSTLTLQLATAGWKYVSDDVVLLSLAGDTVKATGLRRFFALTEQTVDLIALPQIRKLFERKDVSSGKFALIPDAVFPSGGLECCRPNSICFVSVSGQEESEVRQLSSGETMSKLIRHCPWSCYDRAVAKSFLDALAKLVKQCRSFELAGGTDLLGDPAHLGSFLTEKIQQAR